jgi:phosphatidylinositol alpha-mannosyltransferase
MAMLRIAMVCPYSISIPGGVQAQVLGLSRELRALGHEVRVLAPCDGPPPEPFVTPVGNSLPTSANGSIAPVAPDPSAALRTMRALNDEAFDVIHLHEPLVPGPTATALLLQIAPTVGTFHAAGESGSYRAFNRTARWAAGHLNVRVAVSAAAEELARRYLDGIYTVLYNGIETTRFRLDGVSRESGPTILFCGRHEPRKGLETLLEAMAYLPEEFRLWVASDGPEISALEERHRSDGRISWLGRVTDEEKIRLLNMATFFCAPSLGGESFGLVLLEAMAAGTCLVASDIDGYRQVARHAEDGWLVQPQNPAALAEALGMLWSSEETRSRLVSNGFTRARHFSMASLAERYVEIYERLLNDEASHRLTLHPNTVLRRFNDRLLRRPRSAN